MSHFAYNFFMTCYERKYRIHHKWNVSLRSTDESVASLFSTVSPNIRGFQATEIARYYEKLHTTVRRFA